MVKFIHCADIHLDAPFKLKSELPDNILHDVMNASFNSFKTMVDDAIDMNVDFILISGDLFSRDNRSIRADKFIERELNRLKREQIFVYIIRGDEDPLNQPCYTDFPDNVITFRDRVESYELITKSGERIYIHGFSYNDMNTYENKLDHFPTNEVSSAIHIGMLHGTMNTININNKVTEFHIEDLNTKLYHYWALGHVKERMMLSSMPEIHYPGALQSNDFEVTGKTGYMLVEGDHVELNVKFVPVQSILMYDVEMSVSETGRHAIFQDLTDFKEKMRKDGRSIYRIKLNNPHEVLIAPSVIQDIKHQLQDSESNISDFVWIDDIMLSEINDVNTLETEFSSEHLNNMALKSEALKPVYQSSFSKFANDEYFNDYNELLNHGEKRLKTLMREES